MPRTRSAKHKTPPAPAIAVFGWYAVFMLPDPVSGGTVEGLVRAEKNGRAFWAAWWSEDPRRAPDTDPDAYGFVEGAVAFGDAVGAAYNALRSARGPRVYDISLGASYAVTAFREGAPRQRATGTDFEALAIEGFTALGLTDAATEAEVRAAFLAKHPDHGGDPAEDMARLTQLFKAVLVRVKRIAEEQARAAIRGGAAPKRKVRRPKKGTPVGGLVAGTGGGSRLLDRGAMIAEVKRIALGVRARAEEVAPRIEIPASLEGFCEVGSLGLLAALKADGIDGCLVNGRLRNCPHTWVEVPFPEETPKVDPGTLFVDITATQMGKRWPRVLLVAPDDAKRKLYERKVGGGLVTNFVKEIRERDLSTLDPRWWASGT